MLFVRTLKSTTQVFIVKSELYLHMLSKFAVFVSIMIASVFADRLLTLEFVISDVTFNNSWLLHENVD